MENLNALLRVRVKRGINLAVRDHRSSDPYAVISMDQQTLKTRYVRSNCNPEWNEELTLSASNLNATVNLTVFDKDTFTADDQMGEAEIDIKPYIECLKKSLTNLPNGYRVKRVLPNSTNCLSGESDCIWKNGKLIQEMTIRLRNVESGEVVIEIEMVNLEGCKALTSGEGQ